MRTCAPNRGFLAPLWTSLANFCSPFSPDVAPLKQGGRLFIASLPNPLPPARVSGEISGDDDNQTLPAHDSQSERCLEMAPLSERESLKVPSRPELDEHYIELVLSSTSGGSHPTNLRFRVAEEGSAWPRPTSASKCDGLTLKGEISLPCIEPPFTLSARRG